MTMVILECIHSFRKSTPFLAATVRVQKKKYVGRLFLRRSRGGPEGGRVAANKWSRRQRRGAADNGPMKIFGAGARV